MKHEHVHCGHEVKLCEKCDVVFCGKCSKEWGAECSKPHWDYPWYWTTTTPTITPTTADASSSTVYIATDGSSRVHVC